MNHFNRNPIVILFVLFIFLMSCKHSYEEEAKNRVKKEKISYPLEYFGFWQFQADECIRFGFSELTIKDSKTVWFQFTGTRTENHEGFGSENISIEGKINKSGEIIFPERVFYSDTYLKTVGSLNKTMDIAKIELDTHCAGNLSNLSILLSIDSKPGPYDSRSQILKKMDKVIGDPICTDQSDCKAATIHSDFCGSDQVAYSKAANDFDENKLNYLAYLARNNLLHKPSEDLFSVLCTDFNQLPACVEGRCQLVSW